MRLIVRSIAISIAIVTTQASAQTFTVTKTLSNYCSADLPATSFTCGNEDIGYYNGHTDLDNNGVYDILEVGRDITIALDMPPPPAGFQYQPTGPANIKLNIFGDTDSYPSLPKNITDIKAKDHYDIEWFEVALENHNLGRIFDGDLSNDAFNMGVEQDWWGNDYDRGTLWDSGGDQPATVYGSATIPASGFADAVRDGRLITRFGLSYDHNDLTGDPSFNDREEFIEVTLQFNADLVPVTDPPVTSYFSAFPASGKAPLRVNFDATGSDPDGNDSGTWDFGDGSELVSAKMARHTYRTPGEYIATFTRIDSQGNTIVQTKTISISGDSGSNTPPTAAFSFAPENPSAPATIQFDASASSDAEGPINSYQWSFGDGTTGTGQTLSHLFGLPGSYTVQLSVTDAGGLKRSTSLPVEVKVKPKDPVPPNLPPSASFTATPASGDAPLAVSFDASASSDPDSPITSYQWRFGDGTTATGKQTTHSYTTAGSYTASLTVSDAEGLSDTEIHQITVTAAPPPPGNKAPTAAFTATPNTGNAPLTVQFDASSSVDPDGSISSYSWTFGDGATGSGKTATHSYTSSGDYSARLTVTDDAGATASTTMIITVKDTPPANQSPTAAFTTTPNTGNAPLAVQFDASSSVDPDGSINSYSWAFGDGVTGSGKTATHSYTTAGDYTARLTVTDDAGATASTTTLIAVSAAPTTAETLELLPTADVGANNAHGSAVLPTEKWDHSFIKFDLSSVSGQITKATLKVFCLDTRKLTSSVWPASSDNWGPGKSSPREVGHSWTGVKALASVTHTAAGYISFPVTEFVRSEAGGDKIASFELSNNAYGWRDYSSREGTSPPKLIIETSGAGGGSTGSGNVKPVAAFVASPNSGIAPVTISVDASTSSDSDGSIIGYQWDFGDGSQATGLTASHLYTTAGSYNITLTVTDNAGASSSIVQTIVISNVTTPTPPTAKATVDKTNATTADTLQFNSSGSTAPGSTISSWRWDFGDGSNATTATASHRYGAAGQYNVLLTVTTSDGASATDTITVNIATPSTGGGTPQVLIPTDDIGATDAPASTSLFVDEWDHAFLRFDLSSISGNIGSATLRLYTEIYADEKPGKPKVTTRVWLGSSDAWGESSGTPAEVGYSWFGTPLKSATASAPGYIEFDITPTVRSEMVGDGILSLEISNTSSSWRPYGSRESNHKPELVIKP